jgi:hypothetical protein
VSLTPEEFGTAFRRFMQVMNAAPTSGGLAARLSEHLGADPTTVPVLAEEFPSYEHPCLQLALDAVLAGDGVSHERLGVASHNKRFMNPSLSDLLFGDAREGPVDWANVHLGGGTVLPCVRSGLFLITRRRPAHGGVRRRLQRRPARLRTAARGGRDRGRRRGAHAGPAVLSAAQAGRGARITAADLDDAMAGLAGGGEMAQRLLGAAGTADEPAARAPFPPGAFPRGGGFPQAPGMIVVDPS